MPFDVIQKLGNGDPATGLAVLRDTFNVPLAGPVDQIPADTVAEVGHGDRLAGRRVLQKFISRIRNQRITARTS